jgi:hypothetical protein
MLMIYPVSRSHNSLVPLYPSVTYLFPVSNLLGLTLLDCRFICTTRRGLSNYKDKSSAFDVEWVEEIVKLRF